MTVKAKVPVFDESIDPTDPVGAGKTLLGMVMGVFALLAAFGVGRALFNRASQETDQVSEVEVL